MPLDNIGNNVSGSDVDKIRNRKNHPDYEPGFGPSDGNDGGGDDFDNMFNFGDFELENSGSSGSSDSGGDSSFGSSFSGFGDSGNNSGGFNGSGGGFNSPFTSGTTSNTSGENKKDIIDTAIDGVTTAGSAFGHVIKDMTKSVKSKNPSDWGLYFRNTIVVSLIVAGVGIVLGLIGTSGGIKALKFNAIPLDFILGGIVTLCASMPGLAYSAHRNVKNSGSMSSGSSTATNFSGGGFDFGDESDSGGDFPEIDASLLSDDDDDEYESEDIFPTISEEDEVPLTIDTPVFSEPEEVDFNSVVDNVQEKVPILSRAYLVDTFKTFFGCCTPQFSDRKIIPKDSEEFLQLETICIKSLAAAAKKDIEDLECCKLEEAVETFFAYELKVTRYKPLTKTDDIAREVTAYTRKNPDDTSVSTSVTILGDFYLITVYKGTKAIITLGDIFKKQETIDYFKDEGHKLPYVVGIAVDGNPIYEDAKKIESMMIVGRPRFGKSWFVVNIMANLMLFNKPEDIQFIIIDPKKTTMFRTISMLPHVAGFHDDSNILNILRDVIQFEGERRKKLLADNKCDTIWDLRKRKGIKVPILYIFMDEVITIKGNLDKDGKEAFDSYTKTIITQFPYIGIRLIMISHRAQGVIDKTVREQLGFRVAVGAENNVVLEALDLKKFDTALEIPGDSALKMDGHNGIYMKGNAVMTSDEENVEFFRSAAKAFYKMGFDTVDCSSLGCAYNRNEKEIQEELKDDDGDHIQLDF